MTDMTFSEFWDSAEIGDTATVSDGMDEPTQETGLPHKAWRSHNFTGTLVEMINTNPRRMRFELPKQGNATISYTVVETIGHTFTVEE